MLFLPKPPTVDRIKIYLHSHWRHLAFSLLAVIAAGVMTYTMALQNIFYDRPGAATKLVVKREDPNIRPSPLTGVRVPIALADRPVTGIMIENSPDARPQSALSQAGIVFEAVAEGGITRFLTLWQETRPGHIGPVRSLRPYYLDWALGFDARIVHAGGSADAMSLIGKRGAKSMNCLVFSDSCYRVGDRVAPHNLYASFDRIDATGKKLGYNRSSFTSYPRIRKEKPSKTPTNTVISMDFSGPIYATQWRYHAKSNSYLRFIAGAPDKDRENGKQLSTKNLVVIPMPTSYSGSYAVMNTIGKGTAVVFRDGVAIKGTWSKSGPKDQMRLLGPDGKDILLNVGTTWFAVVPAGRAISY